MKALALGVGQLDLSAPADETEGGSIGFLSASLSVCPSVPTCHMSLWDIKCPRKLTSNLMSQRDNDFPLKFDTV